MPTARARSGRLTPSSETSQACWLPPGEVDDHPLEGSMRLRIGQPPDRRDQPFIS